ncbi:MAG: hypothetical protein PVH68_07020, partial [Armatimonadota bacterium]
IFVASPVAVAWRAHSDRRREAAAGLPMREARAPARSRARTEPGGPAATATGEAAPDAETAGAAAGDARGAGEPTTAGVRPQRKPKKKKRGRKRRRRH